jgi:hypothetical protein
MIKTFKLRLIFSIALLVVLNFALSAHAMTSLQSAEGIIIVSEQRAMVNINGASYLILKENTSYTQFENRHVKMYHIRMDYVNGQLIIDFKGFRLIDAFA